MYRSLKTICDYHRKLPLICLLVQFISSRTAGYFPFGPEYDELMLDTFTLVLTSLYVNCSPSWIILLRSPRKSPPLQYSMIRCSLLSHSNTSISCTTFMWPTEVTVVISIINQTRGIALSKSETKIYVMSELYVGFH